MNDDSSRNGSCLRNCGSWLLRMFSLFSMIVTSTLAAVTACIMIAGIITTEDDYAAYESTNWLAALILGCILLLAVSVIVILWYTVITLLPGLHERTNVIRSSTFFTAISDKCFLIFGVIASNIGLLYKEILVREENNDEEWSGRLNHIEETTSRIVSESESRTILMVKGLEERIIANENVITGEIKRVLKVLKEKEVNN
eukprot:CAMPEP_0172485744 /NCGR_PEP_ID=MMETSP1066-20121228/13899_1 /TAXON_ID=671091 /ORGANISM="Coscinodiscus wailesii, Strain CCMP2513" /LENGTH=199 /DNA_ID=CAMNT_0013251179 /DNA_START=684 /DNA_END=1283 /DNA_ORIENTATION=-